MNISSDRKYDPGMALRICMAEINTKPTTLAAELNVTRQVIYLWMKGRLREIDKIQLVANYFGYTLIEFLEKGEITENRDGPEI